MKSNVFWNRGNKTVNLNSILSEANCSKSSDSMGTVSLTIDRQKLKDFDIQIGDTLIIPYYEEPSKYLFYGKIFKISYSNNSKIEITAYDILKYLQGKKYNVFPSIDLGSIVKIMCADLEISYGYLEQTPTVPARLFTDKSYGDILGEYQGYLLYTNGMKIIHRVENNAIAIRNLQNLMTNYLITDDIVSSYEYTESAEDVKNVYEVYQEIKIKSGTGTTSTGEYRRYVAGDKDSMDKLGVLIESKKADDDDTWEQMVQKANKQLAIGKEYKYDVSFTIPGIALLNTFDVIKTKINNQASVGYVSNISWDLINEKTDISLSILGQ